MDGPVHIATICNCCITSKNSHSPSTSPNAKTTAERKSWKVSPESKNRKTSPVPKAKITYDVATQTNIVVDIPKKEEMEKVIKELHSKVEVLEAELKTREPETLSVPDPFEQMTDCSSDDFFRPQQRRRSNKRNGNLTVTTDFSTMRDYDSTFNKGENDTTAKNVKRIKVFKPKNNVKTNNDTVAIGDGNAVVPARLLKHIGLDFIHKRYKKTTTYCIFVRQVLVTHSLTGKPSPAFPDKPAKKKLDPMFLNDIVQTVVEKCCVPQNVVRVLVTHSLTGKPSPAFPDEPAKKKLDPMLVNDILQSVVEKCSVSKTVVRLGIYRELALTLRKQLSQNRGRCRQEGQIESPVQSSRRK
ncbi:unnamed protein product [Danaus chrysippus]|uniref:(African queen) hypothetical protein n=1 Tax=Danaus chrysippus TaxID=151541 RepID=A0A8J2QPE2_9NEOP|nr:unnamed protein product [Danaus chrysippus]